VYTVALRRSDLFSRKLAYLSAASGVALLSAIVLGIGFQVPVAFVLLILGLLLSYVVIVGSSIKVWRLTGAAERQEEPAGEPVAA
jgi:thiosulfate reductase cytochrome b subunit